MKYRKKPVVIEAVQWLGSNVDEMETLFAHGCTNGRAGTVSQGLSVRIYTLEGEMEAVPGDWIIRGVKGELYPCKPDIFAATYEAVEEHETVATPNDPKLSDGGGWRTCCAVGLLGAACVTAVAVRCSAWLGVAVICLFASDVDFDFARLGDVAPVRAYGVDADVFECLLDGERVWRQWVGANDNSNVPRWRRCNGVTEGILGRGSDGEACIGDEGTNLLNECSALGLGADVCDRDCAFRGVGQRGSKVPALFCAELPWREAMFEFGGPGFGGCELVRNFGSLGFGFLGLRFRFECFDFVEVKSRDKASASDEPSNQGDDELEVIGPGRSFEPFEHWILAIAFAVGGCGVGFYFGVAYAWSHKTRATPNDPKLSDRRAWRGTCAAGERRRQEAGAVTRAPVRCSAWLGVSGRIGVGPVVGWFGEWKTP